VTLIIASCHREAQAIARKRKLKAGEWRYVESVRVLEGRRGLTVLRTNCSWYVGSLERITDIEEYLARMRVIGEIESETYVDCE